MDNLINAFLAIGLLVVIILMVYLLDRVNSLEVETKRIGQVSVQAAAQASSAVSAKWITFISLSSITPNSIIS